MIFILDIHITIKMHIINKYYFISTAQTCQSPVVTSKVDTSNDAILSGKTAFIVEFNVACKNSASNVDLYAEFNGAVFPVARNGNNYQVIVVYYLINVPSKY